MALAALIILQTGIWINPVSAQTVQESKLTNKDIVEMSKAGMAETIIIAKINSSSTEFDTSPATLQSLKADGLSDAVILAMVQPKKSSPAEVSMDTASEVLIPDGTEIEVELKNNLSGEEVKMGDVVDFVVVRDVQVNGVTVIQKGASAKANVTMAKKAGRWGKTGKLDWAMKDVQTAGSVRIPVRFTKSNEGGSKGGTVAVAAVATTVLLGPVGLLWGLKKGKKAEIPAGNKYTVFTDGDSTVKVNSANASVEKN